MARESAAEPVSEWLTYRAAARLGLPESAIALRAGRWPIRKRTDTGELEIEVPGAVLAASAGQRDQPRGQQVRHQQTGERPGRQGAPGAGGEAAPDPELLNRIARAVGRLDRHKADLRAKAQASRPKWPWRWIGRRS